ncbi:acyl-CoA thioesterase [Flagellimonas halotolerans]|uniref:Acyl-ACP thioesterase domain-containing protein n=1 Tax=Flagellimonas halotolerans TaxID=3112164 RepID=A0ABU6ITK6_9FLAO|nr:MULTISPECIES: acyl-ACP thioesterase domain-containing protein [unclassified Allomuricauda]MEC3966557.1 acyl-ACP thioesterase domain-containing protein [Muricauda sp. SYSU M86414]MEC4266470.1 acyl-ACP thioesterase domain-containing protein [Muricauda sp. SYSU M84420]
MKNYSESFDVVPDDLDDLNHVNNIRYVEWIQDISKKHWTQVAPKDIKKSMIWVVRNHNITYHKSAVLGNTILISTFIANNKGPISTRVVEIKNKATDDLLVKAVTEWCLLDAKTFRPKRVPGEIQSLFV